MWSTLQKASQTSINFGRFYDYTTITQIREMQQNFEDVNGKNFEDVFRFTTLKCESAHTFVTRKRNKQC